MSSSGRPEESMSGTESEAQRQERPASRRGRLAAVVGVALLAIAAGIGAQLWLLSPSGQARAAERLQNLVLSDPAGRSQNLSQWNGRIRIINFWATWCEPCREEVPALVRIRSKYATNGVEIIGIALDSAEKVAEFAREFSIQYPLVLGGVELIDITRGLGNRAGGLPFTLLLDREGAVVATRLGGLDDAQLESWLRPLLTF